MRALARNKSLVASLELDGVISRLDLSKEPSDTKRPSYSDLYPMGWVADTQAEVHRETIHKIVHWPLGQDNRARNTALFKSSNFYFYSLITEWLVCFFL